MEEGRYVLTSGFTLNNNSKLVITIVLYMFARFFPFCIHSSCTPHIRFNSVDVNGETLLYWRCSFLERLNLLSERDAIISILSSYSDRISKGKRENLCSKLKATKSCIRAVSKRSYFQRHKVMTC